jgi:hypothetical protein
VGDGARDPSVENPSADRVPTAVAVVEGGSQPGRIRNQSHPDFDGGDTVLPGDLVDLSL